MKRGGCGSSCLASLDLNRLMKEQIRICRQGSSFCWLDDKGTVFVRSPRAASEPTNSPALLSRVLPSSRLALEDAAATRELTGHGGDAEIWATAHTISVGGVALHVLLGRSKSEHCRRAQTASCRRHGRASGSCRSLLFCRRGPVRRIRHPLADPDVSRRWHGAWAPAISLARVAPPYPGGELGSLMTVLNHTRLVARTPASRHRGAQRKTAGGRRSWRLWRSNGSMSP